MRSITVYIKEELSLITPHVCGHTYCSHMASAGMNPKYLIEHSDISVTMNTYTHIEYKNVENEFKAVKVRFPIKM